MRYSGFHRAVRYIHAGVRRRWPVNFCNQVELDALDALRAASERAGLAKPSYTAAVTKAIAMAVAELQDTFPELNSMIGRFLGFHWISRFESISAGVAVSRDDDGMDRIFVQVIPEPHRLTLGDLTQRLRHASTAAASELPDYAATRSLYRKPGFLQKPLIYFGEVAPKLHARYRGTFSLTTVGKFGIDMQTTLPLTTPIQFGFGRVQPRPVVRGGGVAVANTVMLTLTFDRNLLNGRPCAELMERVCTILSTADFGEEAPKA